MKPPMWCRAGDRVTVRCGIRRTGINELGNSITLWRRDGPVMISFDDLWSAITHGGQ
ncbi:hypothetical protein GL249_18615 [Escherichia coli]|nr:hypothetical protein [Escherichia coli]